jgi:hypothetical protein
MLFVCMPLCINERVATAFVLATVLKQWTVYVGTAFLQPLLFWPC